MFCPLYLDVDGVVFWRSQADISQVEVGIKVSLSPFDLLAGRTDTDGGSRDHPRLSPEERAPAPRDTELGASS
jgi:hypothetical protein